MRLIYTGFIFAISLFLSGCVHTVDAITLKHKPLNSIMKVDNAHTKKITVKVMDERSDKTKVGTKVDGAGNPAAAIVSTEDVAFFMKKGIEAELVERGFLLADSSSTVIDVKIQQLMSSFDLGFLRLDSKATVKMDILITTGSGKTYRTHIEADGGEKFIQVVGGSNAQIALEMAVDNALQMMFSDEKLLEALSKN